MIFLNIDNLYVEGMVNQIDPSELQLKKANTTYTEAPFFDLYLLGFISFNGKLERFFFNLC